MIFVVDCLTYTIGMNPISKQTNAQTGKTLKNLSEKFV